MTRPATRMPSRPPIARSVPRPTDRKVSACRTSLKTTSARRCSRTSMTRHDPACWAPKGCRLKPPKERCFAASGLRDPRRPVPPDLPDDAASPRRGRGRSLWQGVQEGIRGYLAGVILGYAVFLFAAPGRSDPQCGPADPRDFHHGRGPVDELRDRHVLRRGRMECQCGASSGVLRLEPDGAAWPTSGVRSLRRRCPLSPSSSQARAF